ncbi:MAG: enoyl-CoA hydratase/isomerase family protein [Psychrobium sp.]
MNTEAVIYNAHETGDGHYIIQATLNSEKSLNALNQAMIDSLLPALARFEKDETVVAIVLDSMGDKAFCAGGDIVELYKAMKDQPGERQPFVQEFFVNEYTLDYAIHTYSKPIVVWGNGYVMGGGLGLFAGASHRIVTESSRVAMPEISIGLYPDVGGTYFLNQMPGNLGLFLGLTAAQMNAADCLQVKLADHFLLHEQKMQLIEALTQQSWTIDKDVNRQLVSHCVMSLEKMVYEQMPQGNIAAHQAVIDEAVSQPTLSQVMSTIAGWGDEDSWLKRAKRSMVNGSPLSARILERQLDVGESLTLAQCFKLELQLSVLSGELGEFAEGIRALLIDKDNQPAWKYSDVDSVDDAVIDNLFNPIWDENAHPLKLKGE